MILDSLSPTGLVVPRKGDVDRNRKKRPHNQPLQSSSPARGTWIEIKIVGKEVVMLESSPARGTWIEMILNATSCTIPLVVPRKGDVDRNVDLSQTDQYKGRRPPQGGRG